MMVGGKIARVALSAVLAVGLCPLPAFAETGGGSLVAGEVSESKALDANTQGEETGDEAPDQESTEPEQSAWDGAESLILNSPKTVVLTRSQPKGYYTFTPEEDGWYEFSSCNNDESDPCLEIYSDAEGEKISIGDDDDSGEGINFLCTVSLKANTHYFIELTTAVGFDEESDQAPISYDVLVKPAPEVTALSVFVDPYNPLVEGLNENWDSDDGDDDEGEGDTEGEAEGDTEGEAEGHSEYNENDIRERLTVKATIGGNEQEIYDYEIDFDCSTWTVDSAGNEAKVTYRDLSRTVNMLVTNLDGLIANDNYAIPLTEDEEHVVNGGSGLRWFKFTAGDDALYGFEGEQPESSDGETKAALYDSSLTRLRTKYGVGGFSLEHMLEKDKVYLLRAYVLEGDKITAKKFLIPKKITVSFVGSPLIVGLAGYGRWEYFDSDEDNEGDESGSAHRYFDFYPSQILSHISVTAHFEDGSAETISDLSSSNLSYDCSTWDINGTSKNEVTVEYRGEEEKTDMEIIDIAEGIAGLNARALSIDSPVQEKNAEGDEYSYLSFTPRQSGVYRFFSSGSHDARAYLYDEDGAEVDDNDDMNDSIRGNYNYLIEANLSQGKRYVLASNDRGCEAYLVTVTQRVVGPDSRVAIAAPTASTGFVYDGAAHTGVAAGSGYTLTGAGSAVNAGTYTARASLYNDVAYKWTDGTNAVKTFTWSIVPAQNSMSVAKTTVSKKFKKSKLKKAQTIALPKATAKFGTPQWSVAKKDKKKVLSLSKGKVKVKKGAKKGKYTIQLKAAVPRATNYVGATSRVVTVKVQVK